MTLDRVLDAGSVAVVGASHNPTKRGFQALKTLLDQRFEGPIYPVNPRESNIMGLRCYPSVSAIDGPCDLALITTPAKTVPAILRDCGAKGVAGAVIIAGGFGELGAKGKELEAMLVRTAKEQGIRLIGPNTSGMINLHSRLDLVGLGEGRPGDIALLTQSGNMALSLITEGTIKSQKGFSYYVGVGNEADIRFHEYLAFFRENARTRAVLIYVEGMRDGRSFLQEAYRTTRRKPIIMLKSGRSTTGARSAGSHTGALAGMSEVARSAFRRAGITVVEHSDELFPAAEALSSLPTLRHNTVAILADGGGHATIAADMLTDLGVEVPELHPKTQEKLHELLPEAASVRNPIDVAGGADANPLVFADCARVILQDKHIGGLLVVGLFGGYSIRFAESLRFVEEDAAHQLGHLVEGSHKPIVLHSLYNFARPHSLDLLRYYNIPVHDSLEIACKCVGVLAERGEYLASYEAKTNFMLHWGEKSKPRGDVLITRARGEGRELLLEHEAKELLALHGGQPLPWVLATSAHEAANAAEELGLPVALKIVSPQIVHKSEAGGVLLDLKTADEVRLGYDRIVARALDYDPAAQISGVLVSPMAARGQEVIIGTKLDDQFGPVIMFGIGGVMVEVLKDVSFRVLPISQRTAKRMIDDIKGVALLNGFRGARPVDKKAIRKLLLIVGEMMVAYPEIAEMDLNPVMVFEEGVSVLDMRVLLHPEGQRSHSRSTLTDVKAD
jgi:acetyltransferase